MDPLNPSTDNFDCQRVLAATWQANSRPANPSDVVTLRASNTINVVTATGGGVPVVWKKGSGAFFRLVKCTTSRPPWQAATGGTRHGQTYQEACSSARAGANLAG